MLVLCPELEEPTWLINQNGRDRPLPTVAWDEWHVGIFKIITTDGVFEARALRIIKAGADGPPPGEQVLAKGVASVAPSGPSIHIFNVGEEKLSQEVKGLAVHQDRVSVVELEVDVS